MLARLLLALTVLATACSATCSTPTGVPAITGHALQLDLAACQDRGGSTYDGELWHLSGAGIRCALPLDAGDSVMEWRVFGRHDVADKRATTAVLQHLETALTMAAARHQDVGDRKVHSATAPGEFALIGHLDPPRPVGLESVYSLLILSEGDGVRVGAATVYTTRP